MFVVFAIYRKDLIDEACLEPVWDSRCQLIYKESMTIVDQDRTVYYRPTQEECSCQLLYDGQEDLLFNVDNRHLFYYGFLFQYLHNMVEGRNPLVSYLRSCERTLATQSHTKPDKTKTLQWAWNAFARLLDIDWRENFQCPLCGPCPEVVICDGTMLSFCKDLLEAFALNHPEHTSTISVSHHPESPHEKFPC